MNIGDLYSWNATTERLLYLGEQRYTSGDRRTWHQFAKVSEPEVVWSEVPAQDLPTFRQVTQLDHVPVAVILQAIKALRECYDVTEWPARGNTDQDRALAALRGLL